MRVKTLIFASELAPYLSKKAVEFKKRGDTSPSQKPAKP